MNKVEAEILLNQRGWFTPEEIERALRTTPDNADQEPTTTAVAADPADTSR